MFKIQSYHKAQKFILISTKALVLLEVHRIFVPMLNKITCVFTTFRQIYHTSINRNILSIWLQIHSITTGGGLQLWSKTKNYSYGWGTERSYGASKVQVSHDNNLLLLYLQHGCCYQYKTFINLRINIYTNDYLNTPF